MSDSPAIRQNDTLFLCTLDVWASICLFRVGKTFLLYSDEALAYTCSLGFLASFLKEELRQCLDIHGDTIVSSASKAPPLGCVSNASRNARPRHGASKLLGISQSRASKNRRPTSVKSWPI